MKEVDGRERWMDEVDGRGGWKRWMDEVDGRGGWTRWMDERGGWMKGWVRYKLIAVLR
jgi:hypothetical protein